MKFFDSHSHYNDEKFDEDREEIIRKTKEAGIEEWICAGYDIESSKKALQMAKEYSFIYAICGISPNDVPQTEIEIEEQIMQIEQLLKEDTQKRIVAVGEIGFDYHWNQENKEVQKQVFKRQIELANQYELPIVIHTREAVKDTILQLKEYPCQKNGVFHCCPLNQELIKEALALGYYISFAGPITFKNAKQAKQVVSMVPLEHMLIETDSPYLAPEPKRGSRNDNRNVTYIAQKIAQWKEIPLEMVANQTYQNAKKIFGKISQNKS